MSRAVLLLFLPLAVAQQGPPADFDPYVSKAVSDWGEPGLAIAVVKDDRVVFSKGYGTRTMGRNEPVDERTVFAIASVSKAFTAASLGMMVDDKKLRWDDRVTKYLPDFQLADPYVTREMTVRDLLCHRSGLPAYGGDLLWIDTTYGADEVYRRLRLLQPASSFRSRYAYQNLMYAVAGRVLASISGLSWGEFVRERILLPLGMSNSTTSARDLPKENVVTPHGIVDGAVKPVPWWTVEAVAPCGGINSCVRDMAQWLRAQLGRGSVDGKRLWSEDVSREMWSAQTLTPVPVATPGMPERRFSAYGFGWGMYDYKGRKVLSHSGGALGMTSLLVLAPEEKLGFVILTNAELPIQSGIAYRLLDAYFGQPVTDWSTVYLTRFKDREARSKKEVEQRYGKRAPNTQPSHALTDYAGTWHSDLYGDVRITAESGKLVVQMVPAPGIVGDAEHWHYDTWRVRWRNPSWPRTFLSVRLNTAGEPAEMRMSLAEEADPSFDFENYSWTKAAGAERGL